MKRILTAFALILTFALTWISPAAALAAGEFFSGAPSGLALTEDGGYLVTDVFNKVIWKVAADGTTTRLAGQISVSDVNGEPIGSVADGTLSTAYFQNPWDIAPFLDGYLVSEPDANVIRYFDTVSVQTAAGSGKEGHRDGTGINAEFSFPTGLAAGGNGEVYIADTGNGAIRCLSPDGEVTTVFTGLAEPTGLCWWNGALYVAETGAHCVSKIENGVRTVVVGAEAQDGYVDGYVHAARLRDPQGITVGEDGTLYISDTGNHAVRCLRGDQIFTLTRGQNVIMPRGLLVRNETLLAADPFARTVLTISLTQEKFEDVVSGEWYEAAVYDAVQRGLFNGVGNHRFDPQGTTNRAMLSKMLANLQQQLDGDLVIAGEAELTDAAADSWYGDTARWAVEQGYMTANGTEFAPLREITRQEMTLALFRFAAALGADTSARGDLSAFRDADRVADDARDAMSWALACGLIRGISADELSPDTTTTRAQMVQVMIRFMDLLQNS